jgi:outer membrane protein assembly factor BamB
MKFTLIVASLCGLSFTTLGTLLAAESTEAKAQTVSSADWPHWRGPRLDGSADATTMPPMSWSETENIKWRVPVPGRGHSSPTVVGDDVFLTTADNDRKVQTVICFDRLTGKQRWESIVHEGGCDTEISKKANAKSSFASSTIAVDDDQLYVNFFNNDAVHTTALDRTGKLVWQQKITNYVIHQGYGSSPLLHGPLVIVSADNKGGGAVAGLNRKTGEIVWKHKRPAKPNYSSPIVHHLDGRDQLIMTGCDLVTSLDPMTGKLLWEFDGATTECVTTTVTDGKHVYSSGGYPKNHIAAMVADGSGTITWESETRQYVPSMLIRDGYLYLSLDEGVAACVNAATGEEVWKSRLGGTFSSSPVLVGDLIYATNEDGETYIFRASPEKFEKLAMNKLGESVFATPAICGGQIFARVAEIQDDKRQEYLVCIEKK